MKFFKSLSDFSMKKLCKKSGGCSSNYAENCDKKNRCCRLWKALCMLLSFSVMFAIAMFLTSKYFVKSYIMNNPKVLIESIERMYKNDQEKAEQETSESVKTVQSDILSNPDFAFIGKAEESKRIVTLFTDMQCGYCKKQLNILLPLAEKLGLKLYIVQTPILGLPSLAAARAMNYVTKNNKDKYLKFLKLISEEKSINTSSLTKALKSIGVNNEELFKSLEAQSKTKYDSLIEISFGFVQSLKVQGTPVMIIGTGDKAKIYRSLIDEKEIVNYVNSL